MNLSDFSKERSNIFALYQKSEDDVREYICILREWMSKLLHLPNDSIGDDFMEICLLKNKFSIEKCKMKIEKYCTLKGDPHYGYIYERIPIPSKEPSFYTPLPELTDDYKRIVLLRMRDPEEYQMMTDLQGNAIMREFLLRFDYNDGEICIIDLRNCPASMVKVIRLNIFSDCLTMILQGISTRLSSIHVISKIGKYLLATLLPFLPKKMKSRIHFHDDLDTLLSIIPAKVLPNDYGGELKSMDEIQRDWDKIFEENLQLLKGFIGTKSREDYGRNEAMNGSFRKLNID